MSRIPVVFSQVKHNVKLIRTCQRVALFGKNVYNNQIAFGNYLYHLLLITFCKLLITCQESSYRQTVVLIAKKQLHKGDQYSLVLETNNKYTFVQLAFNLSNGVTNTLESSSILIYLETHMDLYTQKVARCRFD